MPQPQQPSEKRPPSSERRRSASCATPLTRSGRQARGRGVFEPRANGRLEEQRGQGTGSPQSSRGPT
eukprot:380881-Pyramimonas_sp.AAC.1